MCMGISRYRIYSDRYHAVVIHVFVFLIRVFVLCVCDIVIVRTNYHARSCELVLKLCLSKYSCLVSNHAGAECERIRAVAF